MPLKITKSLEDAKAEAVARVNSKASEVILARLPLWKQNNILAATVDIQDKRSSRSLTTEEEAILSNSRAEWAWAKSVRDASNVAANAIQSSTTTKQVYDATQLFLNQTF